MADARDLLRTLAEKDRRGTVWCAALCAASVAHLVPVEERRPWCAVRLAIGGEAGRGPGPDAGAVGGLWGARVRLPCAVPLGGWAVELIREGLIHRRNAA